MVSATNSSPATTYGVKLKSRRRLDLRRPDGVDHPEHGDQPGVLLQADQVVQQRRHHPAAGLRQHHEPHRLRVRQPERASRRALRRMHRLDARPGTPRRRTRCRSAPAPHRRRSPGCSASRAAAAPARRSRAGRSPAAAAARGTGRCSAAANARTGKKTGPRRVRSTARVSPKTAISTPQTSITRMFSHSPMATAGSASQARAGSKKVSCTRGQPGVEVMPTTRARPPRPPS